MKAVKLKPMTTTSNTKLVKLAKKHGLKHKIKVFGLPAARTCPSARDCKISFKRRGEKIKKKCFGLTGSYLWPVVAAKYQWRYDQTKTIQFVNNMVAELKRGKGDYVRLHDIGDFYSEEYLYKWLKIMEALPEKTFWCYTKEVKMFKRLAEFMPSNFRYVFSFGGKHDSLIDRDKDRFSDVITPEEAATQTGTDLTDDELHIINPELRQFYTVAH